MSKHRFFAALGTGLILFLVPALALAADPGGDWEQYQAKGLLWMYLGSFGFGFLTSLTPCVYPMIPIVVGVFGARDESVTRQKAFALATAYVFGMGVMYSILGVIFALLGKQFGTILSNPWVVVPIVLFYVAMAASMFGAFELNLPASLQARLSSVGGKGFSGAFGMGLVGGLTAAPCTGPFLAGMLGFVAQSRDLVMGSSLLFVYALGMGVLFWVIAAFTVSLPKSGRWMEWVKSVGGIALLAAGLYFLRPIVPALEKFGDSSKLFLIGSIAVGVVGLALGAVHLSFHAAWPVRLRKGAGVALTVAGITGLVAWVLTPDRHLLWLHDEEAAFARARAEGKGVLIDFAADWCTPCKELELTFAADEVYAILTEHYVPLKFDVSKGTDEDEARQEKWGAETLPAVVLADASGTELGRINKYLGPGDFLAVLQPATAKLTTGAAGAQLQAVEGRTAPRKAVRAAGQDLVPGAEPAAAGVASDVVSGRLAWLTDEATAFARARAEGKGVLVDFAAEWCAPCEEMEKKTFADPEVVRAIEARYVPLRFDVTRTTDADEALQEKYKAPILPAVIFLDASGTEHGRIDKFVEPADLLARLAKLGG